MVTRLANTSPGIVGALYGFVMPLGYLPTYAGLQAAIVGLAAGIIVAVRGYRMSVEVGEGWVRVHGLFWTRTVPRGAVRAVGSIPRLGWLSPAGVPALRWVDPTGRSRRTPLIMFADSVPQLRKISAHNRRSLAILRQAIGEPG